jgi:putative ABC transport system permease protein
MVMTALNRKLVRDLQGMLPQAAAIALVVAAGVAMYVMYVANFESLRRTRAAYYEQQAFADVFASLKRAPARLAADIGRLPGVSSVETRIVATVTLDLEGLDEPAMARLVSIPAGRRPALNDLFLRRGRWIAANRPDEVLASEGFVNAHRLAPGAAVRAIINGRVRQLTIVGVALSPEYVYTIRPGDLVPDETRFGIFWMGEAALAAAMGMEGAFNDVALRLARDASPDGVVEQLDRLLEAYGGRGAVPRSLQLSHWMVENELNQLQTFGFLLPLLFLLVAAFTLNVALARMLALQRPQIAALKALGYGNAALGWHYMKWALLVAGGGVAIGLAAGAWLGSTIGEMYNHFFRFPRLVFRIPVRVVAGASALTLATAAAGAFGAVRHAVTIPPAEAMRAERPPRYRRTLFDRTAIARLIGAAGRMVLRSVLRHPFRATASIAGIAFAVNVLLVAMVFRDAMERLIVSQFWMSERQDVTVSFLEARPPDVAASLGRLPGVLAVEPVRQVSARIRSGDRSRTVALTGVPATPRLRRVLDRHGREVVMPAAGIVLSRVLAEALRVSPGEPVTLEVLEGTRPIRRLGVGGLVDDVFGVSAYMDLDALHALLREGRVLSGALLLVDPAQAPALSRTLKASPAVAGASFKRTVLRTFRETMAAGMNLTILLNVVFAAVIAVGVVYNAARVSLSERSHELASLRVLGYTRVEVSMILLGELALLTAVALPVGWWSGSWMAALIAESVESEIFRFPLIVSRRTIAVAFLGVLAAALAAGLLVRRRLDRLDLIGVLKVRE